MRWTIRTMMACVAVAAVPACIAARFARSYGAIDAAGRSSLRRIAFLCGGPSLAMVAALALVWAAHRYDATE